MSTGYQEESLPSQRSADLVSVIIPAYNAAKYLRETLDSVFAQTYPFFEVIVVDDGSTDATPSILTEYSDRIQVLNQSNRGSAAARNFGAKHAKGKWLAFVDADDIWLPSKLALQIDRCGQYDISHTDSMCFGETLAMEVRRSSFETPYWGNVLEKLLVRNFITNSSVIVRREVFFLHGGLDESLGGVEDWALWSKICAEHELGYLPEPVVRYRIHRQSKSMQSRKRILDHLRIIDTNFGSSGVGGSLNHLRSQALASSYGIISNFAEQAGDRKFALVCAARALRYQLLRPAAWRAFLRATVLFVLRR